MEPFWETSWENLSGSSQCQLPGSSHPLFNASLTTATEQFAGASRMIILSETKLFYVVLGAAGADITDL